MFNGIGSSITIFRKLRKTHVKALWDFFKTSNNNFFKTSDGERFAVFHEV